MDSKLTVRIDKTVIERARTYARIHNVSLSSMIETYLRSVTQQKSKEIEITAFVECLIAVTNVDTECEIKKDYCDYLTEKYK
jgi:antitoxin component of RelBE/YafQ-DinJ toxin-antitoxin module